MSHTMSQFAARSERALPLLAVGRVKRTYWRRKPNTAAAPVTTPSSRPRQAAAPIEAHLRATGAGALAVTGLAPSITGTETITPGVGALTVSGAAPSLAAGLPANLGARTVTGQAPSLRMAHLLALPAGALAVTGAAPRTANPAGHAVIIGAYVTWLLWSRFGIDPFLLVPVAAAALFVFGFLLYRVLLHRVATASLFMTLILTFGLDRVLVNINRATTVRDAPWDDPSWEIWAHTSVGRYCRRVDRWFELHPPHVFDATMKHGQRDWYGWLEGLREPVYMQEHYPEIPASVRYPKERILTEFRRYLTSTVAWMMAPAITEGVHMIGLWGVHFESGSEYAEQRGGAEFWIGVAIGRGVQVKLPEACPLRKEPADLYGYESHTPEKYVGRMTTWKKEVYAKRTEGFNPAALKPFTKADAAQLLATGVFPALDATLTT